MRGSSGSTTGFTAADRNDLSRILLMGDSISHHYRDPVSEAFKGRAYVSRLGSSSIVCLPTFMDEVRYALSQQTYDVIHFNNGLHGFEYTEEEYIHGLTALVKFLKAIRPAPGLSGPRAPRGAKPLRVSRNSILTTRG